MAEMDEFDDVQGMLADFVRQPGDADALRLLRDTLAKRIAPERILTASTVNLLDRMLDGAIAVDDATVGLLAEASNGLTADDESAYLSLVEQLDAIASGVPGSSFEAEGQLDWLADANESAQVDAASNEPPLLTVRHDGTRVRPGAFEPSAETDSETAPPHREPPTGLVELATALETAAVRLNSQTSTLNLVAGPEMQSLASDMSETAKNVSDLAGALIARVR